MKATPKTDALTRIRDGKLFGGRYWVLKFEGLSEEAINKQLTKEGCPSLEEVEAAFIEETGMSFEAAGEREQATRELEAEARYDERFCR